jgi:hypothetical protein
MPVKTGVDGFVQLSGGASPYADIQGWEINLNANPKSYGSSSTAGHKASVAGVRQCTCSFNAILNTDEPVYDSLKVGDQLTLLLYEDDSRKWTVPVTISTMGETVDMDEGELISVPIEAVSNGAWTYPDGTVSST